MTPGAGPVDGEYTNGTKFRTSNPGDMALVQRLRDKNVIITARPEETASIWQIILAQSIPILFFLGIAFFVVRQMQKNSGSGAMGYHHVNRALVTKNLEVEHPQILLYERTPDGKYNITAVEYIVPYRLWRLLDANGKRVVTEYARAYLEQ